MVAVNVNIQAQNLQINGVNGVQAASAQPTLFRNFDVTAGTMGSGSFQPVAQAMQATTVSNGLANINLGEGYRLELNEHGSQFTIIDPQGNRTRIWGDPHFNYNGVERGDFYTTMTFNVGNGTKITVNTTTWKHANGQDVNGMTLATELIITKGSQAIQVTGLDQNTIGDLRVTNHAGRGREFDAAHKDGLSLVENDATRSGWTSQITGNDYSTDAWMATTNGEKVRERLEFNAQAEAAFSDWLLNASLSTLLTMLHSPKGDDDDNKSARTFTNGVGAFAALPPVNGVR